MSKTTPKSFFFSSENMAEAKKIIAKYPAGKQASAVLPLLDLAQRQNGNWLSSSAIVYVADLLDMPEIKVFEVASFYTMFNLKPVGKYLVQLCRTTPCWLKGGAQIARACEEHLGITMGQTTADGLFTLKEVECLGACVNAPVAQINDDYYEDLTPEKIIEILSALAKGEKPKAGSSSARCSNCSCGKGG